MGKRKPDRVGYGWLLIYVINVRQPSVGPCYGVCRFGKLWLWGWLWFWSVIFPEFFWRVFGTSKDHENLGVDTLLSRPNPLGRMDRATSPELPRPLSAKTDYQPDFPRDHGAHRDYGLEWWYWVGHLKEVDGEREFGFQSTVFRIAGFQDSLETDEESFGHRQLHLAHSASAI